jgi:putative ABC transport system permease protein
MALTVGITVGIPAFADAVSLRILREEFRLGFYSQNLALFYVRVVGYPTTRQPIDPAEAAVVHAWLGQRVSRGLGLPIKASMVELESAEYRLAPRADDTRYDTEYLDTISVRHVQDIGQHIRILEGAPFGQADDPEALSVWVTPSFLERLAIQVGEGYDLGDRYSSFGQGIPVVIAGSWEPAEPDDPFWHRPFKSRYDRALLTDAAQFEQHISTRMGSRARFATWHYVLDDRRANLSRSEKYVAELERLAEEIESRLPSGRLEVTPVRRLERGQERKAALSLVLFGFSFLVLGFLAYFLASLSAMQGRLQESELAVLTSRGSTGQQLVFLAVAESLLLTAAAIPAGIALGLGLAYLLGFSQGFLSFVVREPLQVSIHSVNWLPVIAVVGINMAVRLVVAWRASRYNIVTHENRASRQRFLPAAFRLALVLLAAAVTTYAYRQLDLRGTLAIASMETFDPLTLLAPTLFLLSAPLVAVELFALLMQTIGLAGRLWPWVSPYLVSVNLARDGRHHRMTTYLLIVCLGMGVFYASLARSADTWLLDSERHRYGADLALTVGVTYEQNGEQVAPTDQSSVPLVPLDDYRAVEGVRDATRVAEFRAAIHRVRDVPAVRLLAVERSDFSRVAYFRPDYARASLGALMNLLALEPESLLVPTYVAEQLALEVGDTLRVNTYVYDNTLMPFEFTVVGTFDHFPTMYPQEAPVLVANLDYLELRTLGVLPHDIWLKLGPQADTQTILNALRRLQVRPGFVRDLRKELALQARRLERVGIFGMLSLCFVAGGLLAVANLLVSSTLMMQRRSIGYAVLQALGLRRSKVLETVMMESVVSLVYGLVAGVVCGVLCARLYVPYFPLSDSPDLPVPPFIPLVDWSWAIWIAISVTTALFVAQVVALVRLVRARIFEQLRMGVRP